MFPGRHLTAAATASLLTAGVFFLFSMAVSPAEAASDGCARRDHRLAVAAGAVDRRAAAGHGRRRKASRGHAVAGRARRKRRGQIGRPARRPPYSWFAEVAAPAAGTWHATLTREPASAGCGAVTRDIAVGARKPEPLRTPPGSIWQVRNSWNSTTEALFSAWIEKLFDAPPEQDLNWKVWHEVLRDRSRNFLFNYLGRDEDNVTIGLRPDCADFVYFLRAYFAYKMGLPFGYSNCSRGFGGKPPKCYQWFDIEHPEVTRPPPPPEAGHRSGGHSRRAAVATAEPARPVWPLRRRRGSPPAGCEATSAKPKRPTKFGEYLRDVGDVVQTGAVRGRQRRQHRFLHRAADPAGAAPGHGVRRSLRPRADAGASVPEANGTPGVFLAVDAEPDGSITRKRFWRGNFLFVHDPSLGSPGFKHFRPIMRDKNGPLRRLSNAEIVKNPQYGDFSPEQSQMQRRGFLRSHG